MKHQTINTYRYQDDEANYSPCLSRSSLSNLIKSFRISRAHARERTHMHACMDSCIYECMYVYNHACLHVRRRQIYFPSCMYVCMQSCMLACMYVHGQICFPRWFYLFLWFSLSFSPAHLQVPAQSQSFSPLSKPAHTQPALIHWP